MITVKNVRKEFDNKTVALDNIDMEIHDGEFIALLGPSGCGKSTTLNCIAGLLDVTSGSVFFNGRDVTNAAPKDRGIGMVFQSYALYPHLRVVDNIAFPLKQKGVPLDERREKAREMAKKLQIEHLLDRKPAQLSGGQQQRVAMCRALVKQPQILLLDEPMSNLDTRLKIEIREVIKKIQQELQVTSIIVTHDQEEAMAMADRIAILDNGKIQQFDTPEMLYQKPVNLFVANFMGTPPMNFIDACIEKTAKGLFFHIGEHRVFVPEVLAQKLAIHAGKQVKIGARSHQMMLLSQTQPNALPFSLHLVENLGKELLVSGRLNGNQVRVSVEDKSLLPDLRERIKTGSGAYIAFGDALNVFDIETKHNLVL